jgi:2,3-dihydroxybenzoate decarboxylase
MKIVAIEEHFTPEAHLTYLRPQIKSQNQGMIEKGTLRHIEERLEDMNEAGIDVQVLSCGNPSVEFLDTLDVISVAKSINDELSEVVQKYPKRFAGLATIALEDPDAAADELERAVTKLGLKGTMIFESDKEEYLDEQKYWVIFEKAEKLEVPVYLHPGRLAPHLFKLYYTYPLLAGSMWGFAAQAGLRAMRLICSGVFDKYPHLKIILGHLGEAIPFWLWRISNRWQKEKSGIYEADLRPSRILKSPSQYFRDNFYVTTSGMFWHPVLQFVANALGTDRVLFATDYPSESIKEASEFIRTAPLSDRDKENICHLNAEKLFRL